MGARTPNPWVAVDSVSDRVGHARDLLHAHAAFRERRDTDGVRDVVAESWTRSEEAGIDPEHHLAPIVADARELESRWRRHPLYEVVPILRDLLGSVTSDARHMMAISDADGVLLWIEGHERVIEATEGMHFVPGADWSESGAGTNALGTAIAVDHPVQIFSAEHFNRRVHPWQCSGAPIHDPETGAILGVIDLTGGLRTAHPHTLSLVTAAARMAEAFLRSQRDARDARLRESYLARIAGSSQPTALARATGRIITAVPHDWVGEHVAVPDGGGELELADGTPVIAEPLDGGDAVVLWQHHPTRPPMAARAELQLGLLGPVASARLLGRELELTRRHAEILCLLVLQRRGLTGEQLTLELRGPHGNPVTTRAEVSRLRRVLGDERLRARPYRLAAGVETDLERVGRLLDEGRAGDALAAYGGPLLAHSDVPLIREARERLDHQLRRAIVASGDTDLLSRWCASPSGRDDAPAAELLLSLLPEHDRGHAAAARRVQRLRRTG